MQQRSPVGASASKSNNLLKNTFSLEVYKEYLKSKADKKWKEEQLTELKGKKKYIQQKINEFEQRENQFNVKKMTLDERMQHMFHQRTEIEGLK